MKSARANAGNTIWRLILVDDSEVVRSGISSIIAAVTRFSLCSTTGDYDETASLIRRHCPHLLIAEPFDSNRDGIAWLKELHAEFPDLKLLVASDRPEDAYAERALRAGASGYWLKSGSAEGLIAALDTILGGELYVSPKIARLAVHKLVDRPGTRAGDIRALSDRELHVFALIGAGHGAGRIAAELGISRKTVESHCEHIKEKLNCHSAEELKLRAHNLFTGGR